MQAFLFIDLTTSPAYHKPVPLRIKKALPDVALLDLDAQSGELLQHYALRLLHNSERAVICIKAEESTVDISVLMPLLEELFQENEQRLILLLGQHARLQRIFGARPEVNFSIVIEEDVLRNVRDFLY